MVQTTAGLSLARLTVVDSNGAVVLDAHVKPPGTLLDTNLRFSGVKVEDIENATFDVHSVREALREYIDEETVIVGHGLENDLKALRLIHPKCIDTAIVCSFTSFLLHVLITLPTDLSPSSRDPLSTCPSKSHSRFPRKIHSRWRSINRTFSAGRFAMRPRASPLQDQAARTLVISFVKQ